MTEFFYLANPHSAGNPMNAANRPGESIHSGGVWTTVCSAAMKYITLNPALVSVGLKLKRPT